MEENDEITTVTDTVETPDPARTPVEYVRKTRADRLRENAQQPDFAAPKAKTTDMVFKESVMNLTPSEINEIVRNSGIKGSAWEQTGVAIENALTNMNQLPDELSISVGNLANNITGGQIGQELQDVAFESLKERMADVQLNNESVGGVSNLFAQIAGGSVSFIQLALEGLATGGYLSLAHIGAQSFGEGVYNDMKKYADEHDGSLKGYRPNGIDLAINTANMIMQVAIEERLGVGSPRFLRGWSRGFWKEAGSGFVQEAAQDLLSDFAEVLKGNEDAQVMMENADQYLLDGLIGAILQGPLGAVTYSQARRRSDNIIAMAHAQVKGRKEPIKEDFDVAKKINDAKERNYMTAFTEEFKAAFDASTGEGQLQANIAKALNDAVAAQELDLGVDDETERAQRVEQIATQETLNAMEQANEQGKSIAEMGISNIVYKDGAIWVEGLKPEVGERAVEYASVLAARQTGLAEAQTKLDSIQQELQQTKKDLAEAKAQSKQALADKLQARLDKQNALAEKRKVQAEQLKAQTEKIQRQIAKELEKAPKQAETKVEEVKAVEEPQKAEAQVEMPEPKVEVPETKVESAPAKEEPKAEPKPLAKVAEKTKKYKGEKKSLKQEREGKKRPKTQKEEEAQLKEVYDRITAKMEEVLKKVFDEEVSAEEKKQAEKTSRHKEKGDVYVAIMPQIDEVTHSYVLKYRNYARETRPTSVYGRFGGEFGSGSSGWGKSEIFDTKEELQEAVDGLIKEYGEEYSFFDMQFVDNELKSMAEGHQQEKPEILNYRNQELRDLEQQGFEEQYKIRTGKDYQRDRTPSKAFSDYERGKAEAELKRQEESKRNKITNKTLTREQVIENMTNGSDRFLKIVIPVEGKSFIEANKDTLDRIDMFAQADFLQRAVANDKITPDMIGEIFDFVENMPQGNYLSNVYYDIMVKPTTPTDVALKAKDKYNRAMADSTTQEDWTNRTPSEVATEKIKTVFGVYQSEIKNYEKKGVLTDTDVEGQSDDLATLGQDLINKELIDYMFMKYNFDPRVVSWIRENPNLLRNNNDQRDAWEGTSGSDLVDVLGTEQDYAPEGLVREDDEGVTDDNYDYEMVVYKMPQTQEEFENKVALAMVKQAATALETEDADIYTFTENDDRTPYLFQEKTETPYDADTIEVDGVEHTVYNSEGRRIAKTKEALINFWRWFGDSKMVDENGQPIVVYHGTDADFTAFEKSDVEGAFFFTDKRKVARKFTTKQDVVETIPGTNIAIGVTNEGVKSFYLKAENINEYNGEMLGAGEERDWRIRADKETMKDGIIIYDADTGMGRANEYIVFDATQIKSTDNIGTFDPNEKNFLKQAKVEGTGSDTKRGGYDDRLKRIILKDDADLTTIQHEFAHYWIQNNFKWARSGLASPEWLRKWRDVEEALGIEPQDRFLSKQASEKFARAYERYIMEGKVAEDLQWAFEGFQKFYQDTYEDLESEYFDLSEELDPAIVDWFNRQRPATEAQLKQNAYKKVATVAMAQGASIVTPVNENVSVVSNMNENGDIESQVITTDAETKDSKLAKFSDKKKARRTVEGLREINPDVKTDQYNVLNRAQTVEEAHNWIVRDRAGAWAALNDETTNPIDRTALFQAFKNEAENGDYALGAELAGIKFPKEMTELGQAISVLGERPEFDPLTILEEKQKSLGEPTTEEMATQTNEMGLDADLDAAQVKDLEETTECVL